MAKRIVRIVLNILIVAGVAIILVNILTREQQGLLASGGVQTFRYFTTLSNLLEAVASLLFVIFFFCRKGQSVPRWVEAVKYVAGVEIFVTFLTVAGFLGPIYGYVATCSGNNFWFHLVIPITSIVEQIVLSEEKMGIKENLGAVIPTFVYACFYVINIIINGKGEWPQTNDWYGFLNWGYPIGIVIFVSICLISFLLGLLLRGLWKAAHKKRAE